MLLLQLLPIFALSGCISLPLSTDVKESYVSGYLDGEKSNPDEKIVVESSAWVWHFVGFAPHYPAPEIDHDSTTYRYFLEKNGERIGLHFISDENLRSAYNVKNQWFCFEIKDNEKYFKVTQFGFKKDRRNHKIPITLEGAISELYIDREATILIWREVNMGYHEYNIHTRNKTRGFFWPSTSELEALLKVPVYSPKYTELDFHHAVESENTHEKDFDPLDIENTDSLELIEKASKGKHFLVRWAVVNNPHTSKTIIEALRNDNSYYVASAAHKRIALDTTSSQTK